MADAIEITPEETGTKTRYVAIVDIRAAEMTHSQAGEDMFPRGRGHDHHH